MPNFAAKCRLVAAKPRTYPVLTQEKIKLISALKVKKYRQKYRKFTVEGEKIVLELLLSGKFRPEALYGLAEWGEAHATLLKQTQAPFFPVREADLKKISSLQTPNKVLALLPLPSPTQTGYFPLQDFAFFLDGIQDPGNLGAIWRIADWFGMPALFTSPDTVDAWNPKVLQACMGAFLRVPCVELSWQQALEQQPHLPILGAVLNGHSVYNAKLPDFGLVIIGQEGRGVSQALLPHIQYPITIPKGVNGGAESLNASVAAGILAACLRRPK